MLIGLAHGSRHDRVSEGIELVLTAVSELTGVPTRAAYLDLTDPDLDQVAADLAAAGERTAVVVPLLFTDAFHARIDVPAAVTQAAEASGLDLILAPILGTGDDVVDVVEDRLTAAGTGPDEPVLLYAVGSSRADANVAVAAVAARLAERRGTPGPSRLRDHRAASRRRPQRAAGGHGPSPGTVVPLFVAPGLLLDAFAPDVVAAGWRLAEPLGTLLAPLVSQRYRAVVRDLEDSR